MSGWCKYANKIPHRSLSTVSWAYAGPERVKITVSRLLAGRASTRVRAVVDRLPACLPLDWSTLKFFLIASAPTDTTTSPPRPSRTPPAGASDFGMPTMSTTPEGLSGVRRKPGAPHRTAHQHTSRPARQAPDLKAAYSSRRSGPGTPPQARIVFPRRTPGAADRPYDLAAGFEIRYARSDMSVTLAAFPTRRGCSPPLQ